MRSPRNEALWAAHAAGANVAVLAREFGISVPRVRILIRRLRDRRAAEGRARERPDLISAHQVGGRALKALQAAGITRWDELADASQDSLMRIPRIGPAVAAAILSGRADR